MNNHLYLIRAISPVHYGTGQGIGDIDLPISRDPVTKHPRLPGSGIKGVLRDHFERLVKTTHEGGEELLAVFGPKGSEHASALSMGEARLLALPVRSYFGSFAFLTSPYILAKVKEEAARAGIPHFANLLIPRFQSNATHYHAATTSSSCLCGGGIAGRILLEELDLLIDSEESTLADQWADALSQCFGMDADSAADFKSRLVIADVNVLDFLCETALPVEPHIAIDDEKGTVKGGALWFEENVPVETLFFGRFCMDRSYGKPSIPAEKLSIFLKSGLPKMLQIGGKSTTGKGFVQLTVATTSEQEASHGAE